MDEQLQNNAFQSAENQIQSYSQPEQPPQENIQQQQQHQQINLQNGNNNAAAPPVENTQPILTATTESGEKGGPQTDPTGDEREAKLYVDVNVANFGIKRIIVYEGDTVESLVSDFVKRCPIDEFMVEKLKLLLQQQMDGVLERIDEDEEQKTD